MYQRKYQKELSWRRKREEERKKADDNSRRSRGTAAADLCGDENPGKLLIIYFTKYIVTSMDHLICNKYFH